MSKCNYCYVKELGPNARVIKERNGFGIYLLPASGKLLDKIRDYVCWYKTLENKCTCPIKMKGMK